MLLFLELVKKECEVGLPSLQKAELFFNYLKPEVWGLKPAAGTVTAMRTDCSQQTQDDDLPFRREETKVEKRVCHTLQSLPPTPPRTVLNFKTAVERGECRSKSKTGQITKSVLSTFREQKSWYFPDSLGAGVITCLSSSQWAISQSDNVVAIPSSCIKYSHKQCSCSSSPHGLAKTILVAPR